MLNDKYKLNHCKEMGAEPGRRFLIQPAAKLEPELLLTVQRLHHRQTGSHGTEGLKDTSEDNKWMIVQCPTFPKVWILKISIKSFGYPHPYPVPIWKQFLDIRIRLQTHYPAGYPTGKPDSDHLCTVFQRWALDWIRTIANFVEFGVEPDYKSLKNLRSWPDLDWVKKEKK